MSDEIICNNCYHADTDSVGSGSSFMFFAVGCTLDEDYEEVCETGKCEQFEELKE